MAEAQGDHAEPRDPVQHPAHVEKALAAPPDRGHPPGVRVAQHEAGDGQDDEARRHRPVLQPVPERHPLVMDLRGRGLRRGRAPQQRPPAARFLDEVEEVVQKHPAHDDGDEVEIEGADPVEDPAFGVAGLDDVYRPPGEIFVGARMTGAAGGGQVGAVDRGCGVRGGEDVVDPVAARAVGHLHRSGARGQAVKAVVEGGEAVGVDAVLPGEPERIVAGGADFDRDVHGRHRGARVPDAVDVVLPVTIGAGGGIADPLSDRPSVNARLVGPGDLGVTAPAGVRDVPAADARGGVPGRPGVVGAVAVAARGRVEVARRERLAVHAVEVPGHEGGRESHFGPHRFVFEVALQTERRLLRLVKDRFGVVPGKDGVGAVALEAAGGVRVLLPQRQPMGRLPVPGRGLTVAAPAADIGPQAVVDRLRIFRGKNVVGAMALLAAGRRPAPPAAGGTAVHAPLVPFGLVAAFAPHRADDGRVRDLHRLEPRVAPRAGERPVRGGFEFRPVDKERHPPPAPLHLERGVAVAHRARVRSLAVQLQRR